jgi:hypothetical protein
MTMGDGEPDELTWIRAQRAIGLRHDQAKSFFARFRSSRRAPRVESQGDGGDDPGAAGAGRTAPLKPKPPTLIGSAARRIEDAPDFP